MNKTVSLIIFSKTPYLGQTKTRMQPSLSETECLRLHSLLLKHSLSQVMEFKYPELERAIFFTSLDEEKIRELSSWTGKRCFSIHCQRGGDLGERLANAIKMKFRQGFQKVLIIGTDCPFVGSEDFLSALTVLNNHDVVLGPAEDGGYYLIGFSVPRTFVFEGIPWGTAKVYQETVALLDAHSVSWDKLCKQMDLDTIQNLRNFHALIDSNDLRNKNIYFKELVDFVGQLIERAKISE